MTDYERRRALATLKLLGNQPIIIGGLQVTDYYIYPYGIEYHTADGIHHQCSLNEFSFDIATLSENDKQIVETYEKKRQQNFADGLPKRLRRHSFGAIHIDSGNCKAVERCKTLELGQNLFIHGDPGNGKTMLAVATAREAAAYYTAAVWSATEFFSAVRSSFGPYATKERPQLERVDFLVFDDLDKVKATDFVYEELYTLINARYEHEKTTIFTSNQGAIETSRKVSRDPDNAMALMSRIASGDVVEILGNDQRVLQARETQFKMVA